MCKTLNSVSGMAAQVLGVPLPLSGFACDDLEGKCTAAN